MNSSVYAVLAAQGKREKNGFKYVLATFEGGYLNFPCAENKIYNK